VALFPRRLEHGERAELVTHLDELRRELFMSAAALAVAFAATYTFHCRIIGWLNAPLEGRKPITLAVAEPFTTSLTISSYAAVALGLPVFLWQLWSYLAPRSTNAASGASPVSSSLPRCPSPAGWPSRTGSRPSMRARRHRRDGRRHPYPGHEVPANKPILALRGGPFHYL
jgi:hypothetical protein